MASESADLERFRVEARAWLGDHASLRRGAGDWSNGPRDATWEAETEYFERCRAWQRTLFDAGWAGITWPRSYGGRGGSAAEAVAFNQEQARFDVSSGFLASTIALVGPTLIAHGTEDAACPLPPAAPARRRGVVPALQRAGRRLRPREPPHAPVRDGDELVVDGQKVWTSGARHADHAILLARTDLDATKHRGISYLLVDMSTPGIEVRPLRQITGAAHFNEVFLTDVRVPVTNVVGEIDGGWGPARTTLANESALIGGSTQSGSGAAALIDLARATGRSDDAVTRQRLAEVWVGEHVLGWLGDRVQGDVLAGRAPTLDGSVLKVLWSADRAAKGALAVSLLGACGMLAGDDAPREGFWQTLFLNRFWASIGGGTDEIHRTMIGERALGLPAEPRVDRDVPFRELAQQQVRSKS